MRMFITSKNKYLNEMTINKIFGTFSILLTVVYSFSFKGQFMTE